MLFQQNPIPIQPGQSSGQQQVDIAFTASYVAVHNTSIDVTIAFAPGQLGQQPPGATIVNPTKSYTGQMDNSRSVTVFWSAPAPVAAGDENAITISFSDAPITQQVSDNGVVTINGTVTVNIPSGSAVEIEGTPTVEFAAGQEVAISGTPTVQFAAGQTVDINGPVTVGSITETVNTSGQITNEVLPTNPLVPFSVTTIPLPSLSPGQTVTVQLNGPLSTYDAFWLRFNSHSGQLGFYQFTIAGVGITEYGLATNSPGFGASPSPFPLADSNAFIAFTDQIFFTGGPQVYDQLSINVKNVSTSSIAADTLDVQAYCRYASTNITNPSTSPVPTQAQYDTTSYNLGSYSFSGSVNANSNGPSQFTGSVNVANAKRVQVLIQQTAASGLVSTSPTVQVLFQLQGSNDNSTWYAIGGSSSQPTTISISTNGPLNIAVDSSEIPSMVAGYNYIRWAIQVQNNTSAAVSPTESCNVYLEVQE